MSLGGSRSMASRQVWSISASPVDALDILPRRRDQAGQQVVVARPRKPQKRSWPRPASQAPLPAHRSESRSWLNLWNDEKSRGPGGGVRGRAAGGTKGFLPRRRWGLRHRNHHQRESSRASLRVSASEARDPFARRRKHGDNRPHAVSARLANGSRTRQSRCARLPCPAWTQGVGTDGRRTSVRSAVSSRRTSTA